MEELNPLPNLDFFMTRSEYRFRCSKYIPNPDGSVRQYVLEIFDSTSGETEEILIAPRELISPIVMKRVLMGRRIFYTATRKKHDEMLGEIFSHRPSPV